MQIQIVSVSIERIKEGKKDYSKAEVIYKFQGQVRSQKLISFSNPAVFAKVQEWEVALPEGEVEVEVGKNAQGYNEWRSIGSAGSAPSNTNQTQGSPGATAPRAGTNTFTGGRDFETATERAKRQVLIVKQSSLSAAIELHKAQMLSSGESGILDAVLITQTAQQFTDWVFEGNDNV